jgi:hypothetical protein
VTKSARIAYFGYDAEIAVVETSRGIRIRDDRQLAAEQLTIGN